MKTILLLVIVACLSEHMSGKRLSQYSYICRGIAHFPLFNREQTHVSSIADSDQKYCMSSVLYSTYSILTI